MAELLTSNSFVATTILMTTTAIESSPASGLNRYDVRYLDGSDVTTHIECAPADLALAVQDDVEEGDWGNGTDTVWVDVEVTGPGVEDRMTVSVHPIEPLCLAGNDHDWSEVGLMAGPSGLGVLIVERCERCQLERTTDTGAQRRDSGTRGHTSISYRLAR